MNVVLLHGQNHQGSSCYMGRTLAQKLSVPEEQTEFFLPKDLNHFCTGCFQCIENEEACPFYTNKKKILDAIEKADVLIFTTPTYCLHASASMKAFLDLTFTNWMVHRPKACMFHKKAVIFSSAAGMGTKSAIKDIETALSYWGISEIYSYGTAVQAMGWEQVKPEKKMLIEKKILKIAEKLTRSGEAKITLKTKVRFWMMKKMQSAGWGASPAEKEYWNEHGWLGSSHPW